MPNQQGKLKKIQEFLQEYEDNDAIFSAPAVETDRQKKLRQDFHTVVTMLFNEEFSPNMSISEIKKRMKAIWEKHKPTEWRS